MRIMDERSWASKMGEEDGVGVGRIYDSVGLGAWVNELGRRKGWVGVGQASWVCGSVGQGSGPVKVELQGGLVVVRVEREVRVEKDRCERFELLGRAVEDKEKKKKKQ